LDFGDKTRLPVARFGQDPNKYFDFGFNRDGSWPEKNDCCNPAICLCKNPDNEPRLGGCLIEVSSTFIGGVITSRGIMTSSLNGPISISGLVLGKSMNSRRSWLSSSPCRFVGFVIVELSTF
jgi:hypothetical protein